MSAFEESQWADAGFSRDYLDNADQYIPERRRLFEILRSFYRCYFAQRTDAKVCDLGCGDGVLAGQVLAENYAADVTLVDGSPEMLAAARKRLAFGQRVSFVQKSFQELLQNSAELARFDLVISSFAIHHLAWSERRALFAMIHQHLAAGGFFLNVDVGLPAHAIYTEWQYGLWQEWINARDQRLGLQGEFLGVPRKARENPDNQYSPLADQLEDLQSAGFTEVECHYKYGVFTIYSGRHA